MLVHTFPSRVLRVFGDFVFSGRLFCSWGFFANSAVAPVGRLLPPTRPVLIRAFPAGESTWNEENRFTGWTDVPLSDKGKKEAVEAGQMITEKQLKFDVAFTSVLRRWVVGFRPARWLGVACITCFCFLETARMRQSRGDLLEHPLYF